MAGTLLKYSIWQGLSGQWYTNDTSDFTTVRGQWWVPARMFGITPAAWVEKLITEFKPDNCSFNGKMFLYSWNKEHYTLANNFKNWINAEARKRKFLI